MALNAFQSVYQAAVERYLHYITYLNASLYQPSVKWEHKERK